MCMFVHDCVQTVLGKCHVQIMTALPTVSQEMLENETASYIAKVNRMYGSCWSQEAIIPASLKQHTGRKHTVAKQNSVL